MLPDEKDIERQISAALPCEHIHVHGPDGTHFQALVVSDVFEGLSLVRRHQEVYKAMDGRMATDVHALSIRALTPAEWRIENGGDDAP